MGLIVYRHCFASARGNSSSLSAALRGLRRILRLSLCFLGLTGLPAQASDNPLSPFASVEDAFTLRQNMSYKDLVAFIEKRVKEPESGGAGFFLIAELMKQTGDYRAEEYYEKAIAASPDEAGYELFYADYLRNFRGPQRPLFAKAEQHYFAALEKLRRQPSSFPSREVVRARVERGLVALYQEDGLPLAWVQRGSDLRAPFLFFTSTLRTARSTSDLDEIHDVRDFTAEALFAESALRLNRPLTQEELRGLARVKEPTAFLNRVRVRAQSSWLDVSYERRGIRDAQVTDFFRPDQFNRVVIDNFSVATASTFDLAPAFDASLRAAWQRIEREGLVEFLPHVKERVRQKEGELALSRFFGPDKTDLTMTYVVQNIDPEMANPPRRDRRILGARLTYQILRPLSWLRDPLLDRFATRGWHFFGGFLDDRERFDAVEVKRNDFFVGTSLNGLGRFDVTLQPTVFKVQVTGDRSQSSSQLRADVTLLYRLLDEEMEQGIPQGSFLGLHPAFVHLVIPLRHDSSRDGLPAFENDRIGIGVDSKFFALSLQEPPSGETARFSSTAFLLGVHYSRERFPRLGRTVNLVDVNASIGF